MSETSDGEVKKRRSPRKRAVRKSTKGEGAAVSRVKKAPEPVVENIVKEESPRKAPTPLAAERTTSKRKRNQLLIVLVLLIVGVGSSAAIGYSDKGVINVNEVISEKNKKAKESGDTTAVTIPVQNTSNDVPNGGFVGLGTPKPPAQSEEVASTTASTTDATASSTDETASSTEATLEEGSAEEETETESTESE